MSTAEFPQLVPRAIGAFLRVRLAAFLWFASAALLLMLSTAFSPDAIGCLSGLYGFECLIDISVNAIGFHYADAIGYSNAIDYLSLDAIGCLSDLSGFECRFECRFTTLFCRFISLFR